MRRLNEIVIIAVFLVMTTGFMNSYAADSKSTDSDVVKTKTHKQFSGSSVWESEHQDEYKNRHYNRQYVQNQERRQYSKGFDGFEKDSTKSRLMVMYRLVDQLDLDEDTATKFFPVYLAFIKGRDNLMKEHRELIRSIIKSTDDETVPVKELNKSLSVLQAKEKEIEKQRTDFFSKSKKLLNDRQYVKLVVFNDKLKFELMNHFRSERWRGRSKDADDSTKESDSKVEQK